MLFIFPFREQNDCDRKAQLETTWRKLLSRFPDARRCVVTQADDHKFNRGLLLNCGFLACAELGTQGWVILHDVDLVPDDELLPSYTPQLDVEPRIVHVGARFCRYRSEFYFGGIHALSFETFRSLNGFPNKFWGWGGEDDEFRRRCVQAQLPIIQPTTGALTDLENLTLQDKLQLLRESQSKCMIKRELLQDYKNTSESDGLDTVWTFVNSIKVEKLDEATVKVHVTTHGN